MRSVQVKIILWCFALVTGSLFAFIGVAAWQANSSVGPMRMLRQFTRLVAEQAVGEYERGGTRGLKQFLDRVDRDANGRHYLLDAQGRDLLTGVSHQAEVKLARTRTGPPFLRGEAILAVDAPDHRFTLLVRRPPPFEVLGQIPYFLLILAVMALFCWILAVDLVTPLRRMAGSVRRFGAGDLDVRMEIRGGDEIGQLGAAFNDMAGRIQSLLRAERQLLQDISHELRSPLARLSVSAQLAKRNQNRDAALNQIEREVDRLGVLVGDLISSTKAEGEAAAHAELMRMDTLVRDLCDTCVLEASQKQCRIEFTNQADGAEFHGSGKLLWRAVENVLRNAIRYAPPSSPIEVSLARNAGNGLDLVIRDHGPGVADDELPHLFRPFYRTDPSRAADTGGVGLGLSIAERAVRLHHGEIAAANAGPGLRVAIRLPESSHLRSSVKSLKKPQGV